MEVRADTRNYWDVFRDRQRTGVAQAVIALVSEVEAPLTIAEIADRAGMSRRTFYKHFPTLGSAMVHTHRVVIEQILTHTQHTQQADLNGLDRLLAGFRALFDIAKERPELIRFLSYFDFTFRRHGLTSEQRAEFGARQTGHIVQLPMQALQEGQADGTIRSDLDVRTTVVAMGNSVVGILQRLQIMDEYTNGHDETAQRLFDLELEAWRTYLCHPRSRYA
ncbi:TetR/AcrR family transcriptional regulator [Yinghuangia sp. ASG 101]|uniref:TetR/AcrR family transcriptional regulator n=1 Tax=Yinghuangia sp. ASG 101 TaxID=2896848 RepID=UPI001E6480CD|nr:TetR/AcrR family transcriptional regulator [Yinghuangia sp. ASG 101]UGQ12091.1 TetR/AcrR family transcriptional regulator [Yinghuangia sp. ASG 101]